MVLDMAEEMMRKIPEKVEQEDDEVTTSRPGAIRPKLTDIVSIATGTYFKTHKARSAKREKGKY